MIINPEINISKFLHPEDRKILDEYESSEKVLYKTESEFNNISVVENSSGRFLKFDDSYQSGILNYKTNPNNLPYINYFFISILLNPDIKNILILGMGSGHIIKCFTRLIPDFKNIDVVEIDPDIVKIAKKYFNFEQNKLVNINIQDARVFVRNTNTKYDLIIMDLFSCDGMEYRFMTEEFLNEIKSRLVSGGIFAANLFGSSEFKLDGYIFNSSLKTYKKVFNDVFVFPTNFGNDELYREIWGLKHELSDLTNIILFASNENFNITKNKLILRSLMLKERYNLVEIANLNKYTEDLLEIDLNISNFSVFKDEMEDDLQLNLDNLKNYLYIDHMDNNHPVKINPVDDERNQITSG